jgi:hypothetical protein
MTSERASAGSASTDDLRNAMLQYRALFEELVARPGGEGEGGLDTGRAVGDTAPDSAVTGDAASPERSTRR